MRYKLAPCGCLTDEQGYLVLPPACTAHQMAVNAQAAPPPLKAVATPICPIGHGVMRYSIEDNRFHCHCGAVASHNGNLIVDPDPQEVTHG